MIHCPLPQVSCVTVTAGRPALVSRSIDSYLRQSYPKRELVILSQGSAEVNRQIKQRVEKLDRRDVKFYCAPPDLSLGTMRNTSVDLACGDIICQWDDDDLYGPDRILNQYKCLRSDSRRVATAYTAFIKYFATTGEAYWCDWSRAANPTHRYLCGSIMFYKELFGLFASFYPVIGPESVVREDLHIINKLLMKGEIGSLEIAPEYIYVYHGGNVYGLGHHTIALHGFWEKSLMNAAGLLERKSLIESAFRAAGLNERVDVRASEGVVFTYHPPQDTIQI